MWRKRIVIFLLVVITLVNSAVSSRVEAKNYLSLSQVVSLLGFLFEAPNSTYNNFLTDMSTYPYFVVYRSSASSANEYVIAKFKQQVYVGRNSNDNNTAYFYYIGKNGTNYVHSGDRSSMKTTTYSSGAVKLNSSYSGSALNGAYSGTAVTVLYANFELTIDDNQGKIKYNKSSAFVDAENKINPTPTPTNTPTPTPTNTPTPTWRPTVTPRLTATPRPTATSRPTATPRPGVTFTPRPTATPRLTATPRPTVTIRPTYTPVDSDIQSEVNSVADVVKVVMSLFTVFPLNVILVGWIILLVIVLYKLLKDSIK